MKLIKVRCSDVKPQTREKVANNVFVEIYKDAKGYWYKIDIPGITSFESKDREADQMKARNAGVAHAKKMMQKAKM